MYKAELENARKDYNSRKLKREEIKYKVGNFLLGIAASVGFQSIEELIYI